MYREEPGRGVGSMMSAVLLRFPLAYQPPESRAVFARSSSKYHVPASLCALHHGLEDAQHVPRLGRLDGEVLVAAGLEGPPKGGVEGGVGLGLEVRDLGLAGDAVVADEDEAHRVRILAAKAGRGGRDAGLEAVLLGVEAALAEAAPGAAQPEARLVRLGAQGADADVDQLAVRVGQLGGDGVRVEQVGGAGALGQQAAMDGARHAEQHVGLVDEVGAQVEQRAAARGDAQRALPVGRRRGAVPVKVRVELDDAPDHVVGHEVLDDEEVRVPPPVLVHAHKAPALPGQGHELLGLGGRGHKRLLGEDVLARLERRLGERKVRVGRRRHHHHVHLAVCEQLLGVGVVPGRGVVLRRRVAVPGGSLHDAVKLELRRRRDEGDVEDLGRHASLPFAVSSGASGAELGTHP